ncbi:alkaline shock response membrane anchor protein AmaP [Actinosynnema sp. NPDC020468]|uniref:alkaline shock response membrane anchor protein AmaP n=1 Tax=Actinosynnema sp. NPDC020468 TaxID=3154488 RepID=UPI0033F85B6D
MNRPARLNRVLLALIGLVLLAGGGVVLATHYRVLDLVDPDSPLVPGTEPPPTAVLYGVVAGAAVLGLLFLRWLLAQVAGTRTPTWRVEGTGGRTELASATAAGPFAAEVAGLPGVRAARASLRGTLEAPVLALVVTAEEDGDPGDIRRRLAEHALPRLREALEVADLPTTVEFRFTTRHGARVR